MYKRQDLDIHFLRGEVEFFHSQGIKIALDDFGTGNSSLSLALELPFDELKVDMSFIRDIKQKPQNQAMVQSIVDYARRTNTETCIEGIEDKEVSDYIENLDLPGSRDITIPNRYPSNSLRKSCGKTRQKRTDNSTWKRSCYFMEIRKQSGRYEMLPIV